MSTLALKNIEKYYGQNHILKDINIEIESGDFLVLIGPSGCGKSTLLNAIAGLEPQSTGEILIDDQDVGNVKPAQRDIAMVFQSYALYPNMSVAQNIGFSLEMSGVPKKEREDAISQVSEVLQIKHLLKRKPAALSGGQRQRVAMGRALVRDPRIFLFDEPLSNLDAKLRVDMRTEIKKLHQRLKKTIVYVTHDQVEAMTLATKIAVLKDGKLQQLGTPEEIYHRPNNRFVASFMGSPSMNLFHAKVSERDGTFYFHFSTFNKPQTLQAPVGLDLTAYIDKDITIGCRPENIEIVPTSSQAVNQLECIIELVEPTGSDQYLVSRISDQELIIRVHGQVALPKEDQDGKFALNVSLDPQYLLIFDSDTGERLE